METTFHFLKQFVMNSFMSSLFNLNVADIISLKLGAVGFNYSEKGL